MRNYCKRWYIIGLLIAWGVKGAYASAHHFLQQISPAELQLDSVRTLINTQEYEAALAYLRHFPTIKSIELQVQRNLLLGTIYFHQGYFKKALAQFQNTLTLHGQHENLVFADVNSWIGSCYLRLVEFKKAELYFNNTLALRKVLLGPTHEKVSYVYNNLGLVADENAEHDEAIKQYQLALDIVKNIYGENHYEAADYYYKIGDVYTRKKNYVQANTYIRRALQIFLETLGPDDSFTAQAYYALGLLQKEMGNTKRAITYLTKSVLVFENTYGEAHQKVNFLKHELATNYIEQGELDKAEQILKLVIKNFISREGEAYYLTAHAYEDLGKVYFLKQDKQQGTYYHQKAIDAFREQFGKNHAFTYGAYLSLCKSLVQYGNYAHASTIFNSLEEIGEQLFKHHPIGKLDAHYLRSTCYLAEGNLIKATSYLQKAKKIYDSIERSSLLYNKKIAELELLEVQILLKEAHTKSFLPHLLKANELLDTIEGRLNDLKKYFQSIASGQSLNSQFYDFYQTAVEVNYLLYQETKESAYLERAFAFSEKSKTFVLIRTLQEEEAIAVADIPDSLIQKLDQLNAEIAYKETLLFENAQQVNPNPDIVKSIRNTLFSLQGNHEQLLNQIEREFPAYYQLKYSLNTVPISTIQKQLLRAQQSLIEYFVGDTALYVFVIDRQERLFKKIPRTSDFAKHIHRFRRSIYDYHPLQINDTLTTYFSKDGQALYHQLVTPIAPQLKSDLVIVANGFLEYLPFEALVKRAGRNRGRHRTYQYLIDDHAVSYAYSATWLQSLYQKKSTSFDKEYLGVAPTFTGIEQTMNGGQRNSLAALTFNEVEIKQVQPIFGGDMLEGIAATKAIFKKIATAYRILHLATHGKSNQEAGDYSFLAFTETKDSTSTPFLYVKDLLALDLPTELVVLSACETGMGEMQKGEGVVSIGKGFSYAGAKSILTTLWTINDQTTAKLIPLFFEQLKAGQPKDKALQLAKREFVKNNRDAHPYYWAGYMIIGNTETMEFRGKHSRGLWWGGILGSFCFLLWFFRGYRRRINLNAEN